MVDIVFVGGLIVYWLKNFSLVRCSEVFTVENGTHIIGMRIIMVKGGW